MTKKVFKGRVVVKGKASAEALVSKGGFNTLASYQHSLMFGDKTGKCSAKTEQATKCLSLLLLYF